MLIEKVSTELIVQVCLDRKMNCMFLSLQTKENKNLFIPITRSQLYMIFDFNYSYQDFSFKERAEIAINHVCHIPERVANVITQIVKLVFMTLAAALTFGQLKLLNHGVTLAFGRTITNLFGIVTSTLGFVVPLNAVKLQMAIVYVFVPNDPPQYSGFFMTMGL